MTKNSHWSVNAFADSAIITGALAWLVMTLGVLAGGALLGISPAVCLMVGGVSALPAIVTLVVRLTGKAWPYARQAALVTLPWTGAALVFVALTGGIASPALCFAPVPVVLSLLFGWRNRAVEAAVFMLAGLIAAAFAAQWFDGLPNAEDVSMLVGMQSLAALLLLGFLVLALFQRHERSEARWADTPPPAHADPHDADLAMPGDAETDADMVMIVDVADDTVVRSVSGRAPGKLQPVIGQSLIPIFPEAEWEAVSEGLKSGGRICCAARDGERVEINFDAHDLGTRVFLSTPTEPEKPDLAADIIARDAEARAKAAELALAERTAFFAGLGHELKTPLNAIMGFSDLMRTELRGHLPDTYKDYAQLIHDSGQDLLLVVEDILDYAKAEAGHARLELEPVDLIASGESVIAQLSGHADRSGVAIRQLAGGEVWAHADARAVRQIWQNLLSNAIKYSKGGDTVTVDARAGKASVALSVRDTGAGMSDTDLKRIAQPFQQGENSKGRAGTGLGLAVVKAFADQMRGKVIIDTAPGEGTRVRVILPKALADEMADVEDAAQ